MAIISNLSPLAFEVLKFLCNLNDNGYQSISKDTFGIESQHDFIGAIAELQGDNLVLIKEDIATIPESQTDVYIRNVIPENDNPSNNSVLSIKLNSDNSDICKEMDYYIAAQRDINS